MLRQTVAGGKRACRSVCTAQALRFGTVCASDGRAAQVGACGLPPLAAADTCGSSALFHQRHAAPSAYGRRDFSTDFPMLGVDPVEFAESHGDHDKGAELSEQRFHRAAELMMGELFQRIDGYLREHKPPGASVDMTDGMMRVQLRPGHAITLMKDPTARQLHTSSSESGDISYALASEPGSCTWLPVGEDEGENGWALHELLEAELEDGLDVSTSEDGPPPPLDLEPEPHLHGASTND